MVQVRNETDSLIKTYYQPFSSASAVFCCCCFIVVTWLWVILPPPNMIYTKRQEKYYWCFYGILHQLLLMSPLAFATASGSPLFSEAAACLETLHRPESGTWDESVHMCHAGGHRQCTISDCVIAMSPYHRRAAATKTKITRPGDEAKTAQCWWICTVQHSDSKEGLSCFICLCHFVDHQQSYVIQYHKKSLIQNIQDYCYDESNKKSKLLFTGMKACLLKVDELPQAAIFKEAKKQDEKVLPVYYLLFIPSLYRTRKSNRGCSQALDDLESHKINCHLLSWVLTNDQDAQLENVPAPYKPFFSRKKINPVPCIIKILPKLSLDQTASWII